MSRKSPDMPSSLFDKVLDSLTSDPSVQSILKCEALVDELLENDLITFDEYALFDPSKSERAQTLFIADLLCRKTNDFANFAHLVDALVESGQTEVLHLIDPFKHLYPPQPIAANLFAIPISNCLEVQLTLRDAAVSVTLLDPQQRLTNRVCLTDAQFVEFLGASRLVVETERGELLLKQSLNFTFYYLDARTYASFIDFGPFGALLYK
jgi:hypothetical protein